MTINAIYLCNSCEAEEALPNSHAGYCYACEAAARKRTDYRRAAWMREEMRQTGCLAIEAAERYDSRCCHPPMGADGRPVAEHTNDCPDLIAAEIERRNGGAPPDIEKFGWRAGDTQLVKED